MCRSLNRLRQAMDIAKTYKCFRNGRNGLILTALSPGRSAKLSAAILWRRQRYVKGTRDDV